jgi:L-ribulokinase
VESTAFGAKMIVDRFVEEGVRIDGVIALGGVAKKSPLVMQIVADVLNKPIKVASSEQAVALGSAMAAAVVAGVHNSIPEAQAAMGGGIEMEYLPDPEMATLYAKLFERYKRFGQFIEGETAN